MIVYQPNMYSFWRLHILQSKIKKTFLKEDMIMNNVGIVLL